MSKTEKNSTDSIDWKTICGVAVFVGGLMWGAHHELSTLDDRIAGLDKHISRVETAVRIVGAKQGGDTKTLIDEALMVANSAASEGRAESAKTAMGIANRLLQEQQSSREPAPQQFFSNVLQQYKNLGKSPALADSAFDGTIKLAQYRSTLSRVPAGITQIGFGSFVQKGRFRYIKDGLISGPNAIKMGNDFGFVLDNFYLEDVVFENANIIYKGGPTILQNVRFVNCTFDVRRSSQGEQLLEAAATTEFVTATIG